MWWKFFASWNVDEAVDPVTRTFVLFRSNTTGTVHARGVKQTTPSTIVQPQLVFDPYRRSKGETRCTIPLAGFGRFDQRLALLHAVPVHPIGVLTPGQLSMNQRPITAPSVSGLLSVYQTLSQRVTMPNVKES